MTIDPNKDGVTHINIYSKGKTLLGRMLSNFSGYKVDTTDGTFSSLEGYWYWLCTGEKHNELRTASGMKAKTRGRELLQGFSEYPRDDMFKLKIMNAMLSKLILHPEILKEFKKNYLPFSHYYVYADKVVEPKGGQWIVDSWNHIQKMLKEYPNG